MKALGIAETRRRRQRGALGRTVIFGLILCGAGCARVMGPARVPWAAGAAPETVGQQADAMQQGARRQEPSQPIVPSFEGEAWPRAIGAAQRQAPVEQVVLSIPFPGQAERDDAADEFSVILQPMKSSAQVPKETVKDAGEEVRQREGMEGRKSSAGRGHYSVLPDVRLSAEVERKVGAIARAYFRRTGKPLVITSGTRDASHQAGAMLHVLELGGDIVRLYRNKEAAREIKRLFDEGRSKGRSRQEIESAMTATIRRQMDRGVFLSAHLRAGAVDVRNRDMTVADRRAFVAGVAEVGGIALLEESAPPHFHLEID